MCDILQSGKQPLNFSRGAYPSTLTIHNFDEDSFVYHSLMTRKRSNRFKCQPLGDRTILDKWLNIFVTITARCAYNLLFRVLGFCFVTSRHVRGWSNDGNNDRGFFWLRLIRIDNGDGSFGLNAESHLLYQKVPRYVWVCSVHARVSLLWNREGDDWRINGPSTFTNHHSYNKLIKKPIK